MENEPTLRFRWNDHVPHLSKVFSEQRIDEQYCNTSLVTDDGYIIKVHSIILTMTSGYFERILRNVSQDQHPIIVLNGVNYKELICVIDYIYQGLTRVDERLMASVLDLADILEIKGLSKMKNNMSVKKLIAPSNPHSILSHFHCNSKVITSISSLSQNSDNHTLKVDSGENDCSTIEKERREYEAAHEQNNLCIKDLNERHHQAAENLEDHSQKSENVDLGEEVEDSMDQTLGIDLSLSKSGSSVIINKDVGKNFNFYEDSLIRKRKNTLENSENFQNTSNDIDFGKIGDKVENDALYMQKKHFGKSSGDEEEENNFSRTRSYSAPLFSKNRGNDSGRARPVSSTPSARQVDKKDFDYFSLSESDNECVDNEHDQTTFADSKSVDLHRSFLFSIEDDNDTFSMFGTVANDNDTSQRVTETLRNEENNQFSPVFVNEGFCKKNPSSSDHCDDKLVNLINSSPNIQMIRSVIPETRCEKLEDGSGEENFIDRSLQKFDNSGYNINRPSNFEDKSSIADLNVPNFLGINANKSVSREKYIRLIPQDVAYTSVDAYSLQPVPYNLPSSITKSNKESFNISWFIKDSRSHKANIASNDLSTITCLSKMSPSTSSTYVTKIGSVPCPTSTTSLRKGSTARCLDPLSISLPEMIKVNVSNSAQSSVHSSPNKVKKIFELLDCRKPKSQVKRPLNMFNLYVKSMLPTISSQYPSHTNQQKISLISHMWNGLSSDEKQIWAEKAREVKSEFVRRNPEFTFNSANSRMQREEYRWKKLAKDYLFLPSSRR